MKAVVREKPDARILLLSANILYGTNLTHELRQEFSDKVGFYREEKELANQQIVVCSFESIYKVQGQRFEMMLIDEVRTLGGLVGGATMPYIEPLYMLQQLTWNTPRVVVCDADLLFMTDSTEEIPA
eukprot:1971541-Prymnesium_polylepis.1